MNKLFPLTILLAIVALLPLGVSKDIAEAQGSGNSCGTTALSIASPAPNQTVVGIQPIELVGATSDIVRVRYLLDGKLIGNAQYESGSNSWFMPWNTYYAEPGDMKNLTARVTFNGGAQCETNNPVPVLIGNTNMMPLNVGINPSDWFGQTNTVKFFQVFIDQGGVGGNIPDIVKHANIVWSVSGRGSVTPQPDGFGRYNSGPEEGSGTVKARISYGGQAVDVEAITMIESPYTTTEPDGDNSGSGSSESGSSGDQSSNDNIESTTEIGQEFELESDGSEESDDLTSTTNQSRLIQNPVEPGESVLRITQSDDPIDVCILERLGEENAQRLIVENRRPRSDEFKKYIECFSRQNFVIPSILAPLEPDEVKNVEPTRAVRFAEIKNEEVVDEAGTARDLLVLRGVAEPNSDVLLYVFSEPLVLATSSDEDGNWSYTLEDPLASGEHEVYALVDTGDGNYESSGVTSFIIGQAEATDENPNGYSLELAVQPTIEANNRSVNVFIASTIGIVTFVAVVVMGYGLHKFREPKLAGTATSNDPVVAPEHVEEPTIVQPQQTSSVQEETKISSTESAEDSNTLDQPPQQQ